MRKWLNRTLILDGYFGVALSFGLTMFLRGLFLAIAPAMHWNVQVIASLLWPLEDLPLSITIFLLMSSGLALIFEAIGFVRVVVPSHHTYIRGAIRAFAVSVYFSYVVPSLWATFAYPDQVPFIIGAVSAHIALGVAFLPYALFTWDRHAYRTKAQDD